MFRRLVSFVVRFNVIVLIVMILATGFFASQIFNMEMYTQFLDLFPQDHPYVKVHKRYGNFFGSAYQAQIVLEVKEGDVFNRETLDKIYRIHYDVDLIPGVSHFQIFSLASPRVMVTRETPYGFAAKPIMKEVPKDQQGIEELKAKVFSSPEVNGVYVSTDRKALRLKANFIEEKIDFNVLFEKFIEIKQKEEDANHKIYLYGLPLLYGWIYHYVPEMAMIFGITTLVILGMLFMYMRRGGLWWIPFLTAILSSVWGLGFAAMLGFHFDPLIIVVPFLLSARAISHAVQWTERFVEEYTRLGDTREAALVTGSNLFPPGLLGILTDALGLLVISFTPIPILKNLAYLGTFWAVSVVFTVLIFLPVFFSLLRRIKVPVQSGESTSVLRRILSTMTTWTFGRGRYVVLGMAGAVLLFSVISSTHLRYGDANPGSPILWQDSTYNVDTVRINNRFPGLDEMWVVIEGDETSAMAKPNVARGMEELKQHMMEAPEVGFAISIADLIKSLNMLAHGNDPKMEFIPSDVKAISDLLFLFQTGSGPGDMDQWTDYRHRSSPVRLFLRDHKGDTLENVIKRVEDFIRSHEDLMEDAVAKPAGGLGGILAAANEVIKVKNHQILAMVLGLVFILCSLTYRSFLAGLIYVASLVLANFLAFSYMVFRDIGLNINTLPVVALGIGLGVDYGLYIVSRIREAYQDEKDLSRAVVRGITTAGRAVFFTATMMTAGVVFWYFSPLRFQAEMGFLLGILMMVNMLVGVLVLPAIINIVRPKFIMRAGL